MSRELIRAEAARLVRPGSKVRCVDDGERVIVILEPYAPPAADAFVPVDLEALAFIVPATYKDAQPDNTGFYVKPVDLKLSANGRPPTNASPTPLLGSTWLKFSWALKGPPWDPEKDTLETHLANLEKRFLRRA